jgi:sulfite exporter TauE/SafE
MFVRMFNMQLFITSFVAGLTTGGISCFAVQGSLLAPTLTAKNKSKTLIIFLLAKLIAYTLLGLLLGILGQKLIISPSVQGWFQILIGIYMIIMAINLVGLSPFFKRFVITPPKFVLKVMRRVSVSESPFIPILLGILTIFIPCGVTQGMMLVSISAGNPLVSASIMFAFILGTIPVFFAIGMAAGELFKRKSLAIFAALVIAAIGIFSINSGQVLRGSVHTIQNYWSVLTKNSFVTNQSSIIDGKQNVTITVTSRGYKANVNTLKLGVPVKLTLITNSVAGCSRAFTIPDYNISKLLPVTGETILEFTPDKLGNLTYTCSMGMYSGQFIIIN